MGKSWEGFYGGYGMLVVNTKVTRSVAQWLVGCASHPETGVPTDDAYVIRAMRFVVREVR